MALLLEQTCAICLEELVVPSPNMCMTECSHIFHLTCLLRNMEHNTKCPMCRSDIPAIAQQVPGANENNPNLEQNANDSPHNIERLMILNDRIENMQLDHRIVDIVIRASNNDISNHIETHERVIDDIYNLCMTFGRNTSNYMMHSGVMNNIEIVPTNIDYQADIYNLRADVRELVRHFANSDIRNNFIHQQMENAIHDLCIEFGDNIILSMTSVIY